MRTFSNPLFQKQDFKIQKRMESIIEQESEYKNTQNNTIQNNQQFYTHYQQPIPIIKQQNQLQNQSNRKYDQIFSSETDDSSRFQDSILDRINPFLNKINNEKQQFQSDTTNYTNTKFEKSIDEFLEGKKDQEYIQNYHQQDNSFETSLINMLNSNNQSKPQYMQGSFARKEQYNNALKDMSELANKLGNLTSNSIVESQVRNDNYFTQNSRTNEVKYQYEQKKQPEIPQTYYPSTFQQNVTQNPFQQQQIIIKQNSQSNFNPQYQMQQAPQKVQTYFSEQHENEKDKEKENKLKFDFQQQSKEQNFNAPQKTNISNAPKISMQIQNSQMNQYNLQQEPIPINKNQFQQNFPLQKSNSLNPPAFQLEQNFSTKQHRKIFTQGHKQLLKQAETNYHQNKQINYPFNKFQNQQQPIQNEELPVFCINCEDYVKLSEVNAHSRSKCQKKIFNQDQPKDINEILIDINGKLDYIMKRFDFKLRTEEVKQKSYINSIQQIFQSIQNIIKNNSDSYQVNQCVEIILRERQSFINYTDSVSVLFQIFSQRSIVLAEDKALKIKFCIEDKDQNIKQLENELRSLDKLTQKEKANLEFWKFQADMMEEIKRNDLKNLKFVKSSKMDHEVISQLKSEIESDVQSQTGFTTNSEAGFQVRNTIQYQAGSTGEELKRLFYSEAVSVKLNLPPKHRGRDVLISDLYNEAMLKKIPKNEWLQFLKQKLG